MPHFSPIAVLLGAAAVLAASGLPACLPGRSGAAGRALGVLMAVAGAAAGLWAATWGLMAPEPLSLVRAWSLPLGRFDVAIDALSAFFLMPALLIPALGAVYGLWYGDPGRHPGRSARSQVFYGILSGALPLVIIARDGVLFLMAWEIMALSAYFLITTEDDDETVRAAGWVYLVATHLGTLALMAMFALIGRAAGAMSLEPLGGAAGPALRGSIFLLALLGFGLKAGLMPLHVWLPGAHAAAPSHASAVLSGVMIKAGVYGIARVCGMLPDPPLAWGACLLLLGAGSAVAGIVFGVAQRDLKRLLAYSSIKNIGMIAMGLGLAMGGRSLGRPDWIVLGLGGALLHVWNHALFKSLLFLCAGSVVHAVHGRDIETMGGLAKRMPSTFALFLVGAVAICGLPPLNGFVSELVIYLGLFRTIGIGEGPSWIAAGFAAPALAMAGALAVAGFVKVTGIVFLGEPRSDAARNAAESPVGMLLPAAVLAAACAALGMGALWAAPALDRAIAAWTGAAEASLPALSALAPLGWIGAAGAALLAAFLAGLGALRWRMRRGAFATVGTWDCGYAAPTARMQYTATSFSQMLVHLFAWLLRPHIERPRITGVYPAASSFSTDVGDPVLDRAVRPAFAAAGRLAARLRFLQQGRVQMYVLYILIFLLLLLWILPMDELIGALTGGTTG